MLTKGAGLTGSCRPDDLSSPLQPLPWDPHVLQGRVQRPSHAMPGPRDLTRVFPGLPLSKLILTHFIPMSLR